MLLLLPAWFDLADTSFMQSERTVSLLTAFIRKLRFSIQLLNFQISKLSNLVKKTFTELLNPDGQILVLEGKASPNFESAKPNEAVPVLISSLHCLPTSRNRPVMKIITFIIFFQQLLQCEMNQIFWVIFIVWFIFSKPLSLHLNKECPPEDIGCPFRLDQLQQCVNNSTCSVLEMINDERLGRVSYQFIPIGSFLIF